jgi:hypothetical protein
MRGSAHRRLVRMVLSLGVVGVAGTLGCGSDNGGGGGTGGHSGTGGHAGSGNAGAGGKGGTGGGGNVAGTTGAGGTGEAGSAGGGGAGGTGGGAGGSAGGTGGSAGGGGATGVCTTSFPGRLLFDFDGGANAGWGAVVDGDNANSGLAPSFGSTLADGHTCPGAIMVDVPFTAYSSKEAVSATFNYGTAADWTGFSKLHFWIKIETSTIAELNGVQTFIQSNGYAIYTSQFTNASPTFVNGDWQEVVMDLDPSSNTPVLSTVNQLGVQVLLASAAPSAGPATPNPVTFLVDDIWLEAAPSGDGGAGAGGATGGAGGAGGATGGAGGATGGAGGATGGAGGATGGAGGGATGGAGGKAGSGGGAGGAGGATGGAGGAGGKAGSGGAGGTTI